MKKNYNPFILKDSQVVLTRVGTGANVLPRATRRSNMMFPKGTDCSLQNNDRFIMKCSF